MARAAKNKAADVAVTPVVEEIKSVKEPSSGKVVLRLTGASSFVSPGKGVSRVLKGHTITVDDAMAVKLMASGLFEEVSE